MIAMDTALSTAHGPFLVLVAVTVVFWAAAEIRQLLKRRPGAVTTSWRDEAVVRVALVIGALLAVLALEKVPGADVRPAALAAWVGLVLLWCGVALRIWSFHTLGQYFTLTVRTSSDQPVITSGSYGVIRHPSYAGLLLSLTGIGFFIGNWLSVFALTTSAVVGLVYRIRVEERALLRDLGEPYRQYAASHKRLAPFVW